MLRAGRVDQQHVLNATGLETLEPCDDLIRRAEQSRVLAGDVDIGKARWIVIALGAGAAGQAADSRENLLPELIGPGALLFAGHDVQAPGHADLRGAIGAATSFPLGPIG